METISAQKATSVQRDTISWAFPNEEAETVTDKNLVMQPI